jgi:3-deoxy-D-manno-octulosonate 8-phosphate phosphatase (KDO 8-P phosphatase)
MRSVGLPIAVANARPEVKEAALHITKASGGGGAVREAVEWLLEMRGQKDSVLAQFMGGATAQ